MVRRLSVRDVAQAAGVSVGTVSNFFNRRDAVSEAAGAQIQAAIDTLGYRRNEIASSLRRASTRTLGLLVPSISNPFYTSIIEGIEAEARHAGYTVTLGVTHYRPEIVRRYLDDFGVRRMDGIVVDGFSSFCGQEALAKLDTPAVVIEPPHDFRAVTTICIDNVAAAYDAVEHLIGRGHRRIATITPAFEDPRCVGYRSALAGHGLPVDPDLILAFGPAQEAMAGEQTELIQRGADAMTLLLDRCGFTACFVTLDMFAVGALRTLRERGYRVPEDVALVGFDDMPFAAVMDPPLTTVAQPHRDMGRLAATTLLAQLEGGIRAIATHVVLPHRLVVRQSS